MSVYTALSPYQLKQLLSQYELGEFQYYEGISDGIENTNYHVQTTSGYYVLTIFEHYKAEELPYFLKLMAFLQSHNITVPSPIPNANEQVLSSWQSKPAALFNRLAGQSILQAEITHCQQIGKALAHLHIIGQKFPLNRKNEWGHQQLQQIGREQLAQSKTTPLNKNDTQLLSDELNFQQQNYDKSLPQGIIHADLFRDNVPFENNKLSGILDFYTACNDALLLDLAITVNDWCLGDNSYLDFNKTQAMIIAYEQIRSLNQNEKQSWSTMLRAAALRFWLSRLLYRQSGKEAELTQDKDPNVLKSLLQKHRENISFCQSLIEHQSHQYEHT